MSRMTIAERADAVAKGSGLYSLTLIDMQKNARPLRWWSLTAVIGIVAGYVGTIVLLGRPRDVRMIGFAVPMLFIASLTAANIIRMAGPRLSASPDQPLDERERWIKARAGNLSGLVITLLAIGVCFYQGLASIIDWRPLKSPLEWTYLGLGIEGLAIVLPTLFASWMLPPLPADDEQDMSA